MVQPIPSIATRFPRLTAGLFQRQLVSAQSSPLLVIAGLNTLLPAAETLHIAHQVASTAASLKIPTIFKASFDKANRTSLSSPRGPGISTGLPLLARVRSETSLPVLTDVHESHQILPTAAAVDVLQIPAFLCRQTDLIAAAASTALPLNLKKGQFASPSVILAAAAKARAANPDALLLITERGTTFGYGGLVVDIPALADLRAARAPVVMDATHAAQAPPTRSMTASGGDLRSVRALARAAVAAGVDGVFLEVYHGSGSDGQAPCDAPCDAALQMPIDELTPFLGELLEIARATKAERAWEEEFANRGQAV